MELKANDRIALMLGKMMMELESAADALKAQAEQIKALEQAQKQQPEEAE